MNLETINMGAYNLHIIKTKKFKTITIDVDFYREIRKEEIIMILYILMKIDLMILLKNTPTLIKLLIKTK